MGVNANQAIDFKSIAAQMGVTSSQWMNSVIQIIDPNAEQQQWDPYTNEYTGGANTILWSGPARIQHLVQQSISDSGFTETSSRKVRFQVPNDEVPQFIRKGLQIIVTDGGTNKILEGLSYLVTSSVNSSYAWLRTIDAEVDMKASANFGSSND